MAIIEYESLKGETDFAEVWCPGPLHNTIWALRTDDREPVVVFLGTPKKPKRLERAYEWPELPAAVPTEALAVANDIRHRWIASQPHLQARHQGWIYPIDASEAPTEEQVKAAQVLIDLDRQRRNAIAELRAGHNAPKTLSDKRFCELARADE